MAKNKGARRTVTLECECRDSKRTNQRRNGIFRYTTSKNRRNTTQRLKLRKFCPLCNIHTDFTEIK